MPNDRLSVPQYDGKLFSWKGNEASVEASDLYVKGARSIDELVWRDSYDFGFEVKSHRTGEVVLFVWEETCDNDGEITHWRYRAHLPGGAVSDLTIVVFND
jgi:hypothetical protein